MFRESRRWPAWSLWHASPTAVKRNPPRKPSMPLAEITFRAAGGVDATAYCRADLSGLWIENLAYGPGVRLDHSCAGAIVRAHDTGG